MKKLFFNRTSALAFMLLLLMWSLSQNASAQPLAQCQNYTANITPNGVAIVTAQNLNNGSLGGNLAIMYNGVIQSAITFTCANAGHTITLMLVVTDSLGNQSTCASVVTIVGSPITCNTSNYRIVLSSPVDASSCSTCDGQVAITGLYDPATGNQAPGPYTTMWSDGVTLMQRADLCPNQTYTVTMTDGNGTSYTETVMVGCNGGTTGPNAVCQPNLTVTLTPNGVANVTVAQINGASTGGQVYLLNGNNYASSVQFNCSQVGANTVTLVVVDSASLVSTCNSTVYVVDPSNVCGSGNTTAPVANCVGSLNLDLGVNNGTLNGGYVTLTAQMLNNGSTNANAMWLLDANGIMHSTYAFFCNSIGTHTFYLVVSNANNPASTNALYDTCTVTVTVTDTTNRCGGGVGNYLIIDSALVASTCNGVCNGQYALGYIMLANGTAAPMPYTVVWADGTVAAVRGNLCGNTTYSMTIYDALQNAYSYTIYVACSGNPAGGNCIDTTRIVLNVFCPTVYAPVCGCDGITYANSCIAEFGNGVTSWTNGICNGNPNNNITVTTTGSDCDTSNCGGAATINIANATPNNMFSVQWSDGYTQTASGTVFGGANIIRAGLCTGVYIVTITDNTTANTYTLTVIIGTAQGCVWPGDADDNTTVNNWDLLPIALAHGESGATRTNATINWTGQTATNWNTVNPIAGLANYKHIDCNGDGVINQNDLTAVQQNYGQSYYRGTSSLAGNIPFFINSVTANEGDRLSLPINLGSATDVANDVYGVAFTVSYDTEMVDAGSVSVDYLAGWLGTNLMDIQFDFSQEGKIEVAVARKDRLNVTGFGEIGKLNFTIRDDILRSTTTRDMNLEITNIRLIRNDNMELGTNPQVGIVTVNIISAVTQTDDFAVAVFPNPTKEQLNIRTKNAQIETVTMFNINGQLVKQMNNVNANLQNVSVAELPEGVYMLQITTDKGVENRRVVVAK